MTLGNKLAEITAVYNKGGVVLKKAEVTNFAKFFLADYVIGWFAN